MTDPEVSQILAAVAAVLAVCFGRGLNVCRSAYARVSEERMDKVSADEGIKQKILAVAGDRLTWISCFLANILHLLVFAAAFGVFAMRFDTTLFLRILVWVLGTAVFIVAVRLVPGYESPDADKNEQLALSACQKAVRSYGYIHAVTSVFHGLSSYIADETASPAVTEETVLQLVDEGNESGGIEQSEREMISNVFEFHEMPVEDVMTHRTDVVGVSVDDSVSDLVYTAINSGFSRIPVYRENIDHIEGVIYVKDLLCLIGTSPTDASVSTFMHDVEYIPHSCVCDEAFSMFTEKRIQFAVVVDEYGGTAGVVTMEDLVESIFGSIRDEYDDGEEDEMTVISDGVWLISGTADAEETMEALGAPLPDDTDFDTMGGFVTDLLGGIPDDGETPSVDYKDLTFTVLVAEDMRIERIKAVKHNDIKDENISD